MRHKSLVSYCIIAFFFMAVGLSVGYLYRPTPRFVKIGLWAANDVYSNCMKWESALEEWQLKNLPSINQITTCSTWFMPIGQETEIIY